MTMNEDFRYWYGALAGAPDETLIQRGHPRCGCYRDKNRAVYIYRDANGELACKVTDRAAGGFEPKHFDQIDELFGWVCRHPITYEEYQKVLETGKFSDHVDMPDVRGMGDNSAGRSLDEIFAEQIRDKQDEFKVWLKGIGGEIVTEAHATKAANFKDVFGELEKNADEARKAEKRPLDEQVKAIQGRWNPVIGAAAVAKDYVAKIWKVWGDKELARKRAEEQARREELARKQRESERMAEERGEAAPPPPLELSLPPEKARVSAGTRGKVAMRTRKAVVVTDPKALLTFFAGFDNPPPELVEAASKIAKKLLEAGSPVSGAEIREETYAA